MKKNIIIILLIIISLVLGFMNVVNSIKAASQREIAVAQSRIAQVNADSAIAAQSRAEIASERARHSEIRANLTMVKLEEAKNELAKCK